MKRATAPEERDPQTLEERQAQLERIADKILSRIESGQCNAAERERLVRSYDAIDRIIQRHYFSETDDTITVLFGRYDEHGDIERDPELESYSL